MHFIYIYIPGTPNNQFFYGCFNWMIPNHYIKDGCFTKHPLKDGCLGYQVYTYAVQLKCTYFGVSNVETQGCFLWAAPPPRMPVTC